VCTYLTAQATVRGSGRVGDDWLALDRAVVSYDHPYAAPVDHALCIDLRTTAAGDDPAARVAVELDAASARVLAETILAVLDAPEVRALL